MEIVDVTKENFENEVLKSEIPVLVDFNASWCGPCRMLRPILDELAEERSEYKIVSINIDEEDELAEEYDVSSIPCLVIFKDGKEIKRSVGLKPKESISSMMYDIIIIGAGPAGLTAGIYARRASKKVLILEAITYGGQIINTLDILNYPANPHISGYDFATNLYNQTKELGAEIVFEKAIDIKDNGDTKQVITPKNTYTANPAPKQKMAVLVPDWNMPQIMHTLITAKKRRSHVILLVITIIMKVTAVAAALHP